jgi:hypothetical protein
MMDNRPNRPDWLQKWGFRPIDPDGKIKIVENVQDQSENKETREIIEQILDTPNVSL